MTEKDPEGSTSFEREVAAKLINFSEKLERENYLRAVSARFSIPQEGLRELVAKYGSREGIMARNERPAADNKPKKKKENGVRQAEKILLTWMTDDLDILRR